MCIIGSRARGIGPLVVLMDVCVDFYQEINVTHMNHNPTVEIAQISSSQNKIPKTISH